MQNRLHWLTEDNWIQGRSCVNKSGDDVRLDSQLAEKFDLSAAIKVSYGSDEDISEAISKIKTAFKLLDAPTYAKLKEEHYYKSKGKLVFCCPLYAINDALDNFSEVKKLLFYL